MTSAATTDSALELGRLLAKRRRAHGISQLDLALRLEISQRHLGFVETGRSRPSRLLLASWITTLEFDPSEANAILLKAGFPPGAIPVDPAARQGAYDGMARVLCAHEPYPAFIFTADWDIALNNAGGVFLCDLLMPELWRSGPQSASGLDMIAAMIHPGDFFSQMINPAPVAHALLRQLRVEQLLRPSLAARVDQLEDRLLRDFELAAAAHARDDVGRSLEMAFTSPLGELRFVTAQIVPGLPHDALPDSLRMEVWFPADRRTKDALAKSLA
ncbi:MAG: XRE family transcriptional regulator [Hyphomicrobiales bacterium]|nr:MAG: XRE family transcriptional regulator [Hyphomicrobiales bacterium]